MRRHPFDPLAAALGLAVIALAVAVSLFELDRLEDNLLFVVAGAAVLLALFVIPWRRDPSATPSPDAGDTVEE